MIKERDNASLAPVSGEGAWRPVLPAAKLPAGEMLGMEIAGVRLALFNVDGTFFATDDICSHAYALLSDGWFDDDVVECPLHGGRFCVRDGKALGDPVDIDIRTFPTRTRDGQVEVFLSAA